MSGSLPSPLPDDDRIAEALARALLTRARQPAEWPAHRRAALAARIWEDRGRAQSRAQTVIAACACAAAFLVGIWAASRHQPSAPAPTTAQAAASGSSASAPAFPLDLLSAPPSPGAPRWENIEFAGVGLIEVFGSASYEVKELDSERQLRIGSGVLRAQILRQDPVRPLVVVAPRLRVVVVGTRFDLYADRDVTRVELIEGHVRVESSAGVVELSAGQSVRSDDPRLMEPPPAPRAQTAVGEGVAAPTLAPAPARAAPPVAPELTVEDCGRLGASEQRKRCYLQLADGDSLAAQNALLALGTLALEAEHDSPQALAYWSQFQRRFPFGALAPEAALHSVRVLLQANRTDEAIAAAADFEERFGDDPRAPRVGLLHARLLCGPAGEHAAGRSILERLAVSPDPAVRSEAAQARAACVGPSFGPAGPRGLVPRDIAPGAPPGD